jgi:hypothetical protein
MFEGLYWIIVVVVAWALLFFFALGVTRQFALSHDREMAQEDEGAPPNGRAPMNGLSASAGSVTRAR